MLIDNTNNQATSNADPAPAAQLIAQLQRLIGEDRLTTGTAGEDRYTDVYRQLATPIAVVRPADVAQVQDIAVCTHALGVEIAIRGGGASYTDGYLTSNPQHVLLDLSDLNQIEDINVTGGYVTVQAGTTWAALKDALDKLNVRTPFFGPFSGLHATIGGSVSQHSVSHGSGAHGISAQSVLCMDVVLASGELLQTGSAATGASPFIRHFGPDLTGLFTGDCGVLGIKVGITLPLIRRREAHGVLSFAFDTFEAMHESMRNISQEGIEDTHFALDGALSQGQIARQDKAGQSVQMALSILRSSPSVLTGLKQLIKSAAFARRQMSSSPFMTHYIIEGISDAEVRARIHRMRTINIELGREITATVPAIVKDMPFAPFYNVLGPNAERWVPLHGILAHADVAGFHTELLDFFTQRQQDMEKHGVWYGSMFSAIGTSGFLYELALYWPDELSPYHLSVLPAEFLATVERRPANLAAREYVDTLKGDLIVLFNNHGATHFQLGKAYPYAERLSAPAHNLIAALKHHLDPSDQLAPESLGLHRRPKNTDTT